MSKSLQKCILFAVCIALVCALGVTLFIFDGTGGAVTGQEGQASNVAQNTTKYTHGSNIGRQYTPQGTVHNITSSGTTGGADFKNAITANNGDIVLKADIDLGSWKFSSSTFNYNIYGNGYTITFRGPSTNNAFSVSYTNNSSPNWGAIAGTLTGGIYDLNLRMTGYQVTIGISGNSTINVGVMVGLLNGGTIENCTVTTDDSNGTRIAALKSSSGNNWTSVGGVAGKIASGTVRNITASINGWLEAGVCNSSGGVNSKNASVAGNIAGYIEGGSVTMDNIKVTNNSSAASVMNTQYASNLGMLASTKCNITVTNFYNDYKTSTSSNFSCDNNGGSVTFTHYIEDGGIFGSDTYVGTCKITNYFVSPNAITSVSNSSEQNRLNGVSSTVTIPSGMNVYFDPTASNTANSLAVVFNQTPSASMKYTLVAVNGTKYDNDKTISNAIVFRNLPTAAATWNSGGNFTAVLESEFAGPQHRQPDLQPYEHGYTTGTTSGTAINDGSQFEGLFSKSGSVQPGDTGTYYLTKDIVITGFTGKQFAGTLDGNGHTIYIVASDTALSGAGDATTGFAVGGLVGVLTGTIKNVRVVIDADITVGLDSNKKGRIGGVVGRLNDRGTLDNVQVVIPSDVTISHNTGSEDSGMGGVVGQALGASVIKNVTVQMDGTLAPVGTWTFVSALVAEVPTANGTPTIDMDNIIIRGAGTFAAQATRGGTAEPPYVSALANFNNKKGNEIVNLDGLIYDFKPTISGGGASAYGIFVNNWSSGDPDTYGTYVTTSNTFQMSGNEYAAVANGGTHAGNAPVPLDGELKTINTSVTGVGGATVAAYFMPGTGLVRLQAHSDSWGDERLTISGVEVDDKPIMSSLTTAGDSSSDRYFSVDKSTLSGLNSVQVSLFSNVTDPTVQGLTYTGSPLDIVIDMNYNGAPLTADDYSLSGLTASGGNALVQGGKPLNAGEYSVTVTLNNPDHWFGISGSGEASKTANVTFTVSPKNVTMQDPGDSMTAVYGEKYWILSDNNVWGLDENLFFDEVVGNVEYTATVTRTDDGEGYASASGWLKAGSYTVALTINDSNYAINGNASVTYPLTITPVELSYTLTVENSVAAVYDGNVRTISGTPQGGDGIISAALEGSAGTAGDSVTAAVSVTYGGVAAQIQNAGDYVLGVALSGDDAENYTAVLTASWTDGGAIANNTVTVEKADYDMTGVTFENASFKYDGTEKTITVSGTLPTGADDIQVTVSYSGTNGTALTNAGSTEITATFATTSANYNVPEATKTATLTITPVTLTINDISGNYTDYTAADIVIDDMVSGILKGDTEGVTITPAWDTPLADEDGWLAANTYNATLSLGGDKAVNYTFGSDNVATVTVSPFDLSGAQVTITSAPFTYNGNEQTVLYTVLTGEGGKDITSVLTPTGNTQTNAGDNYTLTLTGGSNFTRSATVNWSIAKKDVTFAWSVSGEIVEGMAADEVKALATETNNGGILAADTYTFGVDIGDYSESTLKGTAVTFTPSVKFTEAGDAANYNITFSPETAQLTVQSSEIAIEVTQATVNTDYVNGYTSAAQFLANFTTSVSEVTIDESEFSVTVTPKDGGAAVGFGSLLDVGEYKVTLTSSVYSLAGTLTYDYVVTATQWTASVAAPEGGLTYDGTDKLGSLVVTPGDNAGAELEGAPEIAAYVEGGMVNANAYTVTLRLQTAEGAVYEGGNFILAAASAEIEIAKRVVEISWAEDTDLIYNGTAHTLTATADFVSGESIDLNSLIAYTGDVTDGSAINAGSYTATITKAQIEEQNANYTLAGESATQGFTISPATLTLTQTAGATLTRPYDGMVTEATSFLTEKYVTITGGVSGENIYGMLNAELTSGVEIKNAGGYVITVTFNAEAAGAGNYSVGDFTSLEIGYTVTAKTITITFDGYEGLTYDGQAHTLTATADFVSDENIEDLNSLIAYTGNVTGGKAINAGSYTATITKAQIEEKNTNYTLAAESVTQEFTISPATLTLTQKEGAQLSRVYDGTATEAGAFVSADYFTVSGYIDDGDEYALFTAAVAEGLTIQNADSYTINITINSGAEGAGNYTCEPFAITYEVTPIQWTASVTAPEGGLTYDGENKLGSLVPTPGDNAGTDIEGAPEIVATVTGGSMVNAGTYTVSLQLQTAEGTVYSGGNYKLTAESAEIVIAKRVVEIIWAEASDFTYNGLAHTLTATVNNKVGEDEVNATVQLGGDNVSVTEEGFTYTVTGLEGAAEANYTIDGAENLTSETQFIARATLTVQFEGITGLVYTGTPYTVTATATGWQNSENYNSTLNGLITIGGDDTQALNAGDYTATITKEALETALDNYTLAQDASVEFTVAPATLNVSVAIAGDGVADNKLTWKVDGAVTVSDTADGWTLTSGETSYTVTVTGADGVASNVLQLTLNGSEYTGTPYGTRVEDGKLAVASTNPNYTVELVTTVIINIVPDISIEIRTGAEYPVSAVYSKDKTYTADDDFAGYFYIDGQPEGGTWDYSVEGVESGSFSNVGTYTVKATFTIASGIPLENHFTFTITQATVKDVVLNGDGAYTYGGLKAGDTVSVTVTYSDNNTATVNATFEAAASKGGYVKAGESVELTLKGDDGADTNYAKVDGQTVTVSVSKAKITADIYYEDIVSADGVLTLTYHGKEGYVVSVNLTGVRDGDVIDGALTKKIIDAGTYNGYNGFEIALDGNDAECYEVTNVADLSVKVTPAEITVEWSNYDGFTYDGTAKTPTATAKGTFDSDEVPLSVTVTGDNATEEGQAINAGDYTATVAAFENGNYKLSADSVQSFSIAKATATLGIDNYQDSVVYNAGAVTVTPTVNGAADTDGIVTVTIAYTAAGGTEAVTVDEIRNAGSYTVTLQISGALNYEDDSKDFVITVTPAELTVTTANKSFTYGDEIDLGATVTALSGDDVSAVIDSVVSGGESAELKNAGSYTVTYRLEGAAAGNYTITKGGDTVDVTINAKKLTFTWNSDQTFTYNGAAQVPGYTLEGVVDGDEVTVTVTVTGGNETEGQAINAGEYTASVAEITEGNYSLTGVQPFSFTIGKAKLTVTPDSVKFSDRDADMLSAYSQTNYEATIKAGVTVTGVDSDDEFNDFTVTTGASFTGENGTLTVGDHTFTISVAGGNYNEAEFTVSVEAQTTVTLTPVPGSTVFTGSAITFTFTGGELESGVEVVIDSITYNSASDGAASVLDAGRYTVTFAVTGNSADNNNWYEVSDWTGTISPAVVDVTAVTAVYGDVYTALETGGNLQNGGVWQFVTFNGSPVEVTVTVTDATARAGETYLGAGEHTVTVTLVSGNYTFEGGSNSVASTLQITPKQLNIAAQLPEDLTYTSEGIVIGLEDYASQLVGDDKVTVSMLVDGKPYVAGVTVLGAGEHTVTVTMDTSDNYQLAAAQQTFTVEKKEVTSSITVSGETIENNSSLEIVHGENARVQNAIDNYLTQNGVEKGEYTLTVTDSAGQAADLHNISAWAPGTYTVNLGLSDNFEGGMTFTIVVQEGTTAQIPDAPVLPSTPLEDGGSSGAANWLFPLIIAIECLIAVALIVAIAVSAVRRSKNS